MMVKDDSLYIVAIVAVVAVVGLVIMATGSSSIVVVAEDLPGMVDSDSTAIAGQAWRELGGFGPVFSPGSGEHDDIRKETATLIAEKEKENKAKTDGGEDDGDEEDGDGNEGDGYSDDDSPERDQNV